MSNGWIKLHRQFKESPYYKESNAKAVWIECLFRASYADSNAFLKRQKIALKAGEFCMGRDEFGASIGISGSTAWYWLLQFEVDSMVDIKKTAKGSIVSVKNWVQYQQVDSTSNNKQTTDEQQMNTYKKLKKDKNEKKDDIHVARTGELDCLLDDFESIAKKKIFNREKRKKKLSTALKTFDADDLRDSWRMMARDKFLNGENDRNKNYLSIDYALRTDRIEHYLNESDRINKPITHIQSLPEESGAFYSPPPSSK